MASNNVQSLKILLSKISESILSNTYVVLTIIGVSLALTIHSQIQLNRLNHVWQVEYEAHQQIAKKMKIYMTKLSSWLNEFEMKPRRERLNTKTNRLKSPSV